MPRTRHTIRFPSYRNLHIYHALAYERKTQTALAKTLGISQVRLSQIARQVRAWVDSILPPRHYLGDEGKRFHLAIARERIRLNDAYHPLTAMFTGQDGSPRYLRRYIAVVNGEALHTIEISEKPDFRLLSQAVNVIGRQAELETIANLGPFADLPNQVHQTIVHRTGDPALEAADESTSNSPSNPTISPSTPVSSTTIAPFSTPQKHARGVLG